MYMSDATTIRNIAKLQLRCHGGGQTPALEDEVQKTEERVLACLLLVGFEYDSQDETYCSKY